MSVELWKDGKYLGVVSARIEEYINKVERRAALADELANGLKGIKKLLRPAISEDNLRWAVERSQGIISLVLTRYDATQEAKP